MKPERGNNVGSPDVAHLKPNLTPRFTLDVVLAFSIHLLVEPHVSGQPATITWSTGDSEPYANTPQPQRVQYQSSERIPVQSTQSRVTLQQLRNTLAFDVKSASNQIRVTFPPVPQSICTMCPVRYFRCEPTFELVLCIDNQFRASEQQSITKRRIHLHGAITSNVNLSVAQHIIVERGIQHLPKRTNHHGTTEFFIQHLSNPKLVVIQLGHPNPVTTTVGCAYSKVYILGVSTPLSELPAYRKSGLTSTIAGVVVGAVSLLGLSLLVGFCTCRQRRMRRENTQPAQVYFPAPQYNEAIRQSQPRSEKGRLLRTVRPSESSSEMAPSTVPRGGTDLEQQNESLRTRLSRLEHEFQTQLAPAPPVYVN
ncbi:hypothetical protein B0H13DRAFT_1902287 [Mycena leptocephala]|nr:hypothetical protein B0H13DRAFT_1902287 [Mycena leptocephala]